jgi:hypothetical protein
VEGLDHTDLDIACQDIPQDGRAPKDKVATDCRLLVWWLARLKLRYLDLGLEGPTTYCGLLILDVGGLRVAYLSSCSMMNDCP